MGIEIFNKPTIKYRIEGFSFFICNAWELMLKSHLIKTQGKNSIYFSDNPDRTISLEGTVKKIFTNDKDPLRINIEKIIDLRNTSTHFITEDYEPIYAPLFQACVINFVNKIQEFHNIDITDFIANNFLSLNLRVENLADTDIRAKYEPEIAEKMILQRNELAEEVSNLNDNFAIPVRSNFFITKNPNDADFKVNVDNSAETKVQIIKDMKDPNSVYPLTTNRVIELVNKRLNKKHILLTKRNKQGSRQSKFTQNDFQLFNKFYNLKNNEKYSYHINVGNRFCYSTNIVELIYDEIKKDPEHIVQNLKNANIKR